MATLITIANGNFTASSTWALCDSTSGLDSEASSTALTASYVASADFTPGAIVIDGIAVKIADRFSASSGTMSVELYNSTGAASVAGTEVTINVADIAESAQGWHFFKFSAPVTLLAATNYAVRAKTSTTSRVSLYRNATAGNWSRLLRTTTQQAPAAGDTLLIMGEHTGQSTWNTISIAMNQTATTTYGNLTATDAIGISQYGTLQYNTSASTNYYLKFKGRFAVHTGGTFSIGTTGTPIPASSTAVLEMDPTANVDTGLYINRGAAFNVQGNPVATTQTLLTSSVGGICSTSGTSVTRSEGQSFIGMTGTIRINGVDYTISSVTNANELVLTGSAGTQSNVTYVHASTGSTLTVASTSGWVAGNEIVLASSTRTKADTEKVVIQSVDSSTQVTLTAPVTKYHSGDLTPYPIQAEVAHLTRNIKIRGISDSLQGYIYFNATTSVVPTTIDWDWAEFTRLGSGVSGKYGVEIAMSDGVFTSNGCSFHSFTVASSSVLRITSTSGIGYVIDNCVFYNASQFIYIVAKSGTAHTINGCHFSLNSSIYGLYILDAATNLTNNVVVSCGQGVSGAGVVISEPNADMGAFSGNTIHSCSTTSAGHGLFITAKNGTLLNVKIWRCFARCFTIFESQSITIENIYIFGCGGSNFNMYSDDSTEILLKNSNIQGGSLFAGGTGLVVDGICYMIIENTNFGTHTSQDVLFNSSNQIYTRKIQMRNVSLASTTDFNTSASMLPNSFVSSHNHNGVSGSHKTWTYSGIITTDTTIFDTSPSIRLTPSSSSLKLESGYSDRRFFVPVCNGKSATISVKVRKSVVGDGTEYNGNQPRLILKKNIAAGVYSDTVIATATNAANGAWEAIGGTTATVTDNAVLQFVVDCDGTTGWVNIDTPVSSGANTDNLNFWMDGTPFVCLSNTKQYRGVRQGCAM